MKTQKLLSTLENGTFFKLKNSNILYIKLYDVLAKESTLCFNFNTRYVNRLDKNKNVIPINIDINNYIDMEND